MLIQKEIFRQPDDTEIKIWRYMDFTKFIALLNSQELFFARTDTFNDPFEGSLTKPTFETINKFFSDNNASSIRPSFGDFLESFRKIIGINCWHMNEVESAAMWKLYLKSDDGIAIQSTYSKLSNSFTLTEEEISTTCVEYIDYESHEFGYDKGQQFNFLELFTHKRHSFSHERELRLVFINSPPKKKYTGPLVKEIHEQYHLKGGIGIKVDLNCLIENVYISPTSTPWFSTLVSESIKKFGFDFPIINSTLLESPMF